ncbi:MAG: hypothetical protein ACK4E3_03585 [Brevundimonas sp.]|uniref:hypothetical protein n=1 Tax=Brevundimonas sp. TaxID=1871086 RepID=UPI00391A24E1
MPSYDELFSRNRSRGPRQLTAAARSETEALISLTSQPEWPVLLAYLERRYDSQTVDPTAPDTGALLMIEGSRIVIRDLKRLADEMANVGSSEHD